MSRGVATESPRQALSAVVAWRLRWLVARNYLANRALYPRTLTWMNGDAGNKASSGLPAACLAVKYVLYKTTAV